jgi:hypothetical protein
MKTYKGSCHCGAISFSFKHQAIKDGLRCNCSICKRKGAVMSTFILSPDEIEIKAEDGVLSQYQFDTKIAKHYFCKHCGIYPFHQTMRKAGFYRINLGCIDEIDTDMLKLDIFDGKSI